MRLAVPAGVSVADAQRRAAPDYTQVTILDDGTDLTTSKRASATATPGASANTKGSWVQVVAATTNPITMVYVSVAQTAIATTATSALLDIGIGAAASEVVIVPNLAVGWIAQAANTWAPAQYAIPVNIPVGSRVAIRCQVADTSVASVTAQLVFGQLPNRRTAPTAVLAIGANPANSRGVDLTLPGATNTKSAWTEITSATTQPLAALAVGLQGAADASHAAVSGLLDIGYGASGSENVLVPDIPFRALSDESIGWICMPPPLFPCRLPAGTRLAARYQNNSSVTDAFDVILYGIPE